MKKVIRLTESDLMRIVKRVISEQEDANAGSNSNINVKVYWEKDAKNAKCLLNITTLKKNPKVVGWSGKSTSNDKGTKDTYGQFFCGTNNITLSSELNKTYYVDRQSQELLQKYCF